MRVLKLYILYYTQTKLFHNSVIYKNRVKLINIYSGMMALALRVVSLECMSSFKDLYGQWMHIFVRRGLSSLFANDTRLSASTVSIKTAHRINLSANPNQTRDTSIILVNLSINLAALRYLSSYWNVCLSVIILIDNWILATAFW